MGSSHIDRKIDAGHKLYPASSYLCTQVRRLFLVLTFQAADQILQRLFISLRGKRLLRILLTTASTASRASHPTESPPGSCRRCAAWGAHPASPRHRPRASRGSPPAKPPP